MSLVVLDKEKIKCYFENLKSKFIFSIASINEIDNYLTKKENKIKDIKMYKYKDKLEINLFNNQNNILASFIKRNNKIYLKYFCLYYKDDNKLYEREMTYNFLVNSLENNSNIFENFETRIYLEKIYQYFQNKLISIKYIDLSNNKNILQEFFIDNTNLLEIFFDKSFLFYKVNFTKKESKTGINTKKIYQKIFKNSNKFKISQIENFFNKKTINKKFLVLFELRENKWNNLLFKYKITEYKNSNKETFQIKNFQIFLYNINNHVLKENSEEIKSIRKEIKNIFQKEIEIYLEGFNKKEISKYMELKYKNIDKLEIEIKENLQKIFINFYKFFNSNIYEYKKYKEVIYNTKDKNCIKKYFQYNMNKLIKKTEIFKIGNKQKIIINKFKYNFLGTVKKNKKIIINK